MLPGLAIGAAECCSFSRGSVRDSAWIRAATAWPWSGFPDTKFSSGSAHGSCSFRGVLLPRSVSNWDDRCEASRWVANPSSQFRSVWPATLTSIRGENRLLAPPLVPEVGGQSNWLLAVLFLKHVGTRCVAQGNEACFRIAHRRRCLAA